MNQKIVHKRSNVVTDGTAKLPTADQLDYGELAINYADGNETITIKNSNNDIVSFKSQEYIDDNELFTKGTGENSIVRKNSESTATGEWAFAEGIQVTASGYISHAEGGQTKAIGTYSHAEGSGTLAYGNFSHTEGNSTIAGDESDETKGHYAHAEGDATTASGAIAHAEGSQTTASGETSHAEGAKTTASGKYAHAEGLSTTASGQGSHTEGYGTKASAYYSHAEGLSTTASANYAHAEGEHTTASEQDAHAEGVYTTASAKGSHTEGIYTEAIGEGSHAEGCYNVPSKLSIHSVGIGTLESKTNAEDILRSNGYKYLIGLGNYDGTNLTVTSGETESVNSNIKSVQEILNKLIEEAGGLNVLFSPYQAVDLGLPSGLKWANMNVGATSETDAGLYFQWGDTVGYTIDQLSSTTTTEEGKKYFGWSDYKYCGGSMNTMTKYCNDSTYGSGGFTDSLTTLESSDDAATANMGKKWRMPTQAEFQELIDNTTSEWTTKGRKFINKNDSSKYIFIPAAGYLDNGSKVNINSGGNYWSSSLYTSICHRSWFLNFGSGELTVGNILFRYYGMPVRGVLKQ